MFRIVEALAQNQIWLFMCGMGLTVVPFAGIMFIHRNK